MTLGRQFTPSYWIAGYADPTWAAEFSMVNNMQFFYAPYRTDGAVQYKTPAFHGLSGRFMMSNGEGDSSKAGRFISTALEYREGPLFLGLASEQQHTKDIFGPTRVHSSRDNYLSAVYRIGAVEPTFIFHSYNGYYAYPPYIAFNARVGTYSSARVGKSMAATASTPAWSAVTTTKTSACPAPPASSWALSTACPSAPTCTPASPVYSTTAPRPCRIP